MQERTGGALPVERDWPRMDPPNVLCFAGAYASSFAAYLIIGFDEDRWPFALLLLAVGLSMFILGMLVHRYGKAWGKRFVRRRPPSLPSL